MQKHRRISIKSAIIYVVVILMISSFSTYAFAKEKEQGNIRGLVKAKKARYLRDIIVYIEHVTNSFEPPEEHAVMDQKNMAFVPHVLPVLKGTTVDFLNSDIVQHNIYSPDDVADYMNLGTWLMGEVRSFTFNKTGVASLRCNVHVDMLGYILVLQNPYFARVDKKGNFSIENVPEGEYTLKLWSERFKAEDQRITVREGSTTEVIFVLKR